MLKHLPYHKRKQRERELALKKEESERQRSIMKKLHALDHNSSPSASSPLQSKKLGIDIEVVDDINNLDLSSSLKKGESKSLFSSSTKKGGLAVRTLQPVE